MEYQYEVSGGGFALFAGMGIFFLVIGLAVYLFFSFCIKKMGERMGEDTGLWWVPIAQYLILTRGIDKPGVWVLLFMIPFVNIIAWIEVAKRLGHDQVWGIIAGLFNIVGVPYLAFAEPSGSTAS